MNAAQKWRNAVASRAGGACEAVDHDVRCQHLGHHAHHCIYRAHLTREALWVVENGAFLSLYCHNLAHHTHNANLDPERLRIAVDAVNALMPHHLRRPYFLPKF